MKIKFAVLLIILLAMGGSLFAPQANAQGAFYRIGPFPQPGLAYVCPVPDGGTPCPSPSAIFSNVTLTTALTNPISMAQGATVSFYISPGSYTIQFPASGFNQIVTIGSGGPIPLVTTNPATCATGQTFFNTATSQYLLCVATNTLVTAAGSPSTTIDVTLYGAVADNRFVLSTASWSNAVNPANITCPSNDCNFVAARDNGKTCWGISGGLNTAPVGTLTVVSAQAANCTGLTTAAAVANGTFVWGTNNTTALQAADTALQAACPQQGSVLFPTGYIMVSQPIFITQTAACRLGPTFPGETAGAGFYGQGINNTVFIPMPGFNFAGCVAYCMFSPGGGSGSGTNRRDFSINGLGQTLSGQASFAGSFINLGSNDGTDQNIGLYNYGNATTSALSIASITGQGAYVIGLQADSFGKSGITVSSPEATIIASFVASVPAGNNVLGITGNLYGYMNRWDGSLGSGNNVTLTGGAKYFCYGDYLLTGTANSVALRIAGGSFASLNGCTMLSGAQAATTFGIFYDTTGGTVSASDSTFNGGATNGWINCANTPANFIDRGGNSFAPSSGIVVSPANCNFEGANSVGGTTITAAKLVLSAGWGASAAWTALTGNTRLIQGTITNTGAGQAANPTITYTFPTPFPNINNVICSATQVGGTQAAIAGTFTPSGLSTTAVTFTYNGTPTVNLTEIVQISCDSR